MKKVFVFAALAAAVLATACSKEGSNSQQASAGVNAIGFRAVVDKSASRASLVTATANLTNFYVQAGITGNNDLAFMEAPVLTPDKGTTWTYSPIKYYPTTGTLDFFAYAPIQDINMTSPMENSTGVATCGYTVPADQSVMNTSTDFLVASALAQAAPGPVALTFDHALSAATFSASNQYDPATNLIARISKIEITELDNVGTYTFSTPLALANWTNAGTGAVTYTAGIPESGVSVAPQGSAAPVYVNLLSANDVMMILPQTPIAIGAAVVPPAVPAAGDGTYVVVTYTITDATGTPVSGNAVDVAYLSLPAGFTFDPGTQYDFRFNFGAATGGPTPMYPITFTVDVNAWVGPTVTAVN